jgi:hypothetical protein
MKTTVLKSVRRTLLAAFATGLVAPMAMAQYGSVVQGSATMICDIDYAIFNAAANRGFKLRINYSTGRDAGKPGLIYIAAADPTRKSIGYLTAGLQWGPYTGGYYPPYAVHVDAMPSSINIEVPFGYTNQFQGWGIYAGHGVYTPEAQSNVSRRRQLLSKTRAKRVAEGKWNAAYDSDWQFMLLFVQRDMTSNQKWGQIFTMPNLYEVCPVIDNSGG